MSCADIPMDETEAHIRELLSEQLGDDCSTSDRAMLGMDTEPSLDVVTGMIDNLLSLYKQSDMKRMASRKAFAEELISIAHIVYKE